MKCDKCNLDFEEKDIQESHDVPVYMFNGKNRNERKNQSDKLGRHWLCKRCHDIYEKSVSSWMIKPLPDSIKETMIKSAVRFSQLYFIKKEEKEDESI